MSEKNIIFGWHAVLAAFNNPEEVIIQLFLLNHLKEDHKKEEIIHLALSRNILIEYASRVEMDKLANTNKHQGIIVLTEKMKIRNEEDCISILEAIATPLILILDQVQDPHNLGAILRTADAAGVSLVIAPKDRAASITPIVRKVASGAAETMPFIPVTNLARVMRDLKDRGIWIYGLAGDGTISLFQQNLLGPLALVMGAEGKGLRQNTRNQCDGLLSIPMAGAISSLNVSVATGVALFEVLRQRSQEVKK